MTNDSELRPIVTYPRDAILDRAHVAAAFGVDIDKVSQMDLPSFYIGARQRYIWGQVLDCVAERASADAQPHARPTFPRRRKREL